MCGIFAFWKSYILTKFLAWEKCPNAAGCLKIVTQVLRGDVKLCDSSFPILWGN